MSGKTYAAADCQAAKASFPKNKKSPPLYGKQGRAFLLLSDAELIDDSAVSVDILLHEVAEKVSSLTDHFKKTAS